MQLLQTAETLGEVLAELGKNNEDIFVVDADLMKASGSKLFFNKFRDRHINVGVAEQNLVGVAAGIAAMGRIPFACTMANFISQRACDQVFLSVAYNNFNVKLIGVFAGLSQEKNGGTHISIMDIAIMRCMPRMKIFVPADRNEYSQILSTVVDDYGPAYIRAARHLPDKIFDDSYKFSIGKGYQYGNGCDLTVISTGISTHIAFQAIEELKKEKINARLLHLSSLKPVDSELIKKCLNETKAVITIEDHSIYGGLGGLISEIISEEGIAKKLIRIGLNDTFGLTAILDFQLHYFGISIENIVAKAKIAING